MTTKPTEAAEHFAAERERIAKAEAEQFFKDMSDSLDARMAAIEARFAPTPDADPLAGLTRGRIVMYYPLPAEARHADAGPWAAIVTNVGPQSGQVTLNVNLPIPCMIGTDPVARRTEVPFDAEHAPGSWAWPERAS